MAEILQTAPSSNPMPALFDELLAPGSNKLIWRAGPGRGAQIRRAFSGLFGAFFARAYLQRYHGFVWFAAISGEPMNFSSGLRIIRKPGLKS